MSNHNKQHISPCQIYDLKEAANLIAAKPGRASQINIEMLYGTLTKPPEPLKPSLKRYFKSIRIGSRFYE